MLLFTIILPFLIIYLIGGAVIGVAAVVNRVWPIYDKGSNTIQSTIDGNKSAPFLIVCGPLFWIVLSFMWLFTSIWNMVDWEK